MAFVEVYLDRIYHNAAFLNNLCAKKGIGVVGVTKVTCGDPAVARSLNKASIKIIGESRIENIERMKKAGIDSEFMLLRPPERSKIKEALELADYFLVSDLAILEAFVAADIETEVHGYIYMVDTGDLREGVWYREAEDELKEALKIARDKLLGIGTNLGCYGGVIATPEKFQILIDLSERLKRFTGFQLKILSAGNTASLPLVEYGTIPEGINQFRLGESIVCGTDVTNNRIVPGTRQDTFILHGEIIELKRKPSVPEGEIGQDAFGRKPHFEDRGVRLRAILDLGEQDVLPSGLIPLEQGIEVLHASSDHLIVDLTECPKEFRVGDTLSFRMSYGALLRVMTSKYVRKEYIHELQKGQSR
ncbi:alanine/ornithine racemase family PLP-dependent enzyme [Kosmotoga pacifica]|uniref:Alanine racemase n=1 Tax=Kosmotoga pacifica TaxID=1330330 RepID=A0A0G2ZDX0_9BACT|nr:alanine/ornithine racemase family PLP-dependent enzyme [Kosmotoga pacifica]AKI96998.1 alanine racemase [Kosmotoga pacifica]